ncbi:phytanoyl-CoA dioxygenase family protein [Sphingobium sp. WCS2017Hpa-17]|uniref:phytanoyl-CoA dioxygenase family protein n=1 Tax=Sphingobium sp. WCS2017Hpa-17 TaxID=3073638 RepID=UPI00288B08C5|nr:phytanoyl-CoA dioxygenase family protein [Sphingobium sp. WCS2017Hpa-17]
MNPIVDSDRLPQPSSDVEINKRNLDEFGYAIHADLLSLDQVAALKDRLVEQSELECEEGVATYRLADRDIIGDRQIGCPPSVPAWQAVLALPNKGQVFIDALMHPVVLDYGRHILGNIPFYLAQSTGLVVRNGSGGQIMHSDQIAVPFETPVPVYFHAMIALSDFELGMGVTEMVPGSHRWPAPRFDIDEATGKARSIESAASVPMTCKAGSAIIFESRVWHFQGRSTSDKTRLSLLNGYCLHFIRPQDDYAASIMDDVYERLTQDERRMLGFEVVQEYTGRLFPRSPDDRRHNVNFRAPYIPELRRGGDKHAVPFEGMGSEES